MRHLFIALTLLLTAPAAAQDAWWHGEFVPEGPLSSCDNDALVRYESGGVYPWETSCQITQQTKIRGMDGVLLDLDCTFPDSPDEGYKERQLLLKIDEQTIFRHPGAEKLLRCPVPPKLLPETSAERCDWNDRIWVAEGPDNVRQELRFPEGAASGSLTINEYRKNVLAWAAQGEFMCSNGAVICYVELPTTRGDEITLPYETLTASDGSEYLVIPSLSQSFSYAGNAVQNPNEYGGLTVTWQSGFKPTEWEKVMPSNIYQLKGCAAL